MITPTKNTILTCLAVAAIGCLPAAYASAATIALGAEIPLGPNLFVVPITISDGTNVIAWAFDVSYDAPNVQVNTACDPFSGDIYCSLFTGPVTEGDFFASGQPFNLLNPGFVALDPNTLLQTGLLFGVNGAFGGAPPGVSGGGVLAYVEFLTIGAATSPITLQNVSVTETPAAVPEPGTLALVATGVLLSRVRRKTIERRVCL
jgi:PEP-CTERM motif-containing protein